MCGEELRLHHGIDRRVAAHHQQRERQQCQRRSIAPHMREAGEHRQSAKRAYHAERDQHRPTTDAVRQRADQRLHAHEDRQRSRRDERRIGLGESCGIHQELLRVRREGVERDGAASRQAEHRQH